LLRAPRPHHRTTAPPPLPNIAHRPRTPARTAPAARPRQLPPTTPARRRQRTPPLGARRSRRPDRRLRTRTRPLRPALATQRRPSRQHGRTRHTRAVDAGVHAVAAASARRPRPCEPALPCRPCDRQRRIDGVKDTAQSTRAPVTAAIFPRALAVQARSPLRM